MRNPEAYPAYPTVQYRNSALGMLFKYAGLVAIAALGCGTGVAIRTLNMLDGRVGHALKFASQALTDLPAELKNIAPILADAAKDRRDPAYAEQVEISGSVVAADGDADEDDSNTGLHRRRRSLSGGRAVVEIRNKGKQVVSVMALRLVALDQRDLPLHDQTIYGATPLAIENEWCGPLMPGSTRKLVVRCDPRAAKVDTEISELRVWDPTIADAPARPTSRSND